MSAIFQISELVCARLASCHACLFECKYEYGYDCLGKESVQVSDKLISSGSSPKTVITSFRVVTDSINSILSSIAAHGISGQAMTALRVLSYHHPS